MHYGLGGINGGGGAGGGGRDELPVWSVLVSSMTRDHKISKDCRSTSCLNVHVAHATHVQAAGLNSTTRSKMKASAASAADCSAALSTRDRLPDEGWRAIKAHEGYLSTVDYFLGQLARGFRGFVE